MFLYAGELITLAFLASLISTVSIAMVFRSVTDAGLMILETISSSLESN